MLKGRLGTNILVTITMLSGSYSVLAQLPECTGVECVKVISIQHGTRCQHQPNNSVSVDIQNKSGTMYMMGYAVFATPQGPIRSATGYLAPGATINLYSCNANGDPTFEVNTGPRDTVRAPMYHADNVIAADASREPVAKTVSDYSPCNVGEKSDKPDGEYKLPGVAWEFDAVNDAKACPAVYMAGIRISKFAVYGRATSHNLVVKGGRVTECKPEVNTSFEKCITTDETKNYPRKRFSIRNNTTATMGQDD